MMNKMVPEIIVYVCFNYIKRQVQVNIRQRIPQTTDPIKVKMSRIAGGSKVVWLRVEASIITNMILNLRGLQQAIISYAIV